MNTIQYLHNLGDDMNYKLAIMSSILLLNVGFAQQKVQEPSNNIKANITLPDNMKPVEVARIAHHTPVYDNKDFISDKNTGRTRAEVKEEFLSAQKAGELSNLKQFFNY